MWGLGPPVGSQVHRVPVCVWIWPDHGPVAHIRCLCAGFQTKENVRGGSNESQCIMPGFWFRCLEGEGHVLCFVPSGHFGQSF